MSEVDVSGIENAKGWKKATDKVVKIQQEWRSVGFTSKKQQNKMWEEFRALCDQFFEKKKSRC